MEELSLTKKDRKKGKAEKMENVCVKPSKGSVVCILVQLEVEILSAGDGRCLAQMVVAEEHQNTFGTLHGGFTATVVDEVSTLALMTTGSGHPGVSVDLNVSYLKAANLGDKILIDAKTLKAGKRLAFLEVEIKKESGELIAKGSHTKFVSS
uniref:Thioesterase domain-containing protein n=1 Tax=Timema douglasi TaxID=61478 RepID=A0A7R8VI12_TIMDO|nr:unnamed protein product [Timema douglasi]